MKKYKINKGFIVQKLDGKITIFDGEKSMLYTFNETASFIFQKIKKGIGEKEIIQALVKKYKIKEDRAKKDVKEIIKDLLVKKIIKI